MPFIQGSITNIGTRLYLKSASYCWKKL